MANKTNSAAQTLSVPQGGGALQGIGERFSPDPHTGTGNFSVPIAVPAGRNGFQPELGLSYSTGSGNGPYGLGWSIPVPAVSRKTSKGIPRYDAASPFGGGDTFVLSDDLVPVSTAGEVTRYRPRTEGQFARIERILTSTTDHWEVRTRDGLMSVYGTPSARAADPAAISNPERRDDVFSWKLTKAVDPFGNTIQYEYERDTDASDGRVGEQVYLKRIRYVDYAPQNAAATGDAFLVSLTFLYDARPDPFSELRSGFEIRTRRRCAAIEVRTHADRERMVRVYRLGYLDQRELPSEALPANGVSLLSQVVVEGHDGDERESLPPLEFGYTTFEPAARRFQPLATDLSRPDRSLAHPDFDLVDLFGNGLPTFVELNEQVRYWRNRGDGAFDRMRTMPTAPAGAKLSEPGVQLLDAEGNGRSDLMVLDGSRSGFYPLNFAGEWDRAGFVPYRASPTIDLDAPDVRLLDLDGDGVTDALRTGSQFELYYNDPEEGWSSVELRERQQDDDFPNVSFTDPRIKLADLTGDGLQDIVRVHDGAVEYWPYRGYGRWGRRVVMRNAPRFDDAALFPGTGFDPKRLLVGDVDGDGAADLVYVSSGHVTAWINQHGNAWSDPIVIHGTPVIADTGSVRLADMLGNGTDGVLWTYDAGTFADSTCKFLDLTGGTKPYLLRRMDNQMGAVTEISYAPSTRYYLEDDRQSATRWRTPLPFPVQVVSRVDIVDRISGGRLATEFRYHHGYWDGIEREFRGFGMVEQLDAETFGDGGGSPTPGLAPRSGRRSSPPLLTRTWFHQGAVQDGHGDWQEPDWSSEYWAGDPAALTPVSNVNDFLATLPDPHDRRDALRTLRGSTLRSELYALDGSERERRPYTVSEQAYALREESAPAAGELPRQRVFFPHTAAQRTTQWERGIEPMTSITFTADYDGYGQAQRQVSLAVPRHRDYRSAVITAAEPYVGTLSETRFATRDETRIFMVNRVSSAATWEIVNDGRTTLLDLYQEVELGRVERKLFAHTFHYYDGDAFVGLPFGELGEFGAPVRTESLVLTEEILRDVYRDESAGRSLETPPYLKVEEDAPWPAEYPDEFRHGTPALAGYTFADGSDHRPRGYYVDATRVGFDFHHPSLPARGLIVERHGPLGNDTVLVFDEPYHLLPVRLIDAVGLTTEAAYDYRVLQAQTVTDANGNRTAVAFSPLGLVTGSALMGKAGEADGDTLEAPGNRLEYDLFAFVDRQQPVFVRRIAREHHVADTHVPLPIRDATIVSVEYSDGFGRLLQTRTQTDSVLFGAAPHGDGVLPVNQGDPGTDVVTGASEANGTPHVVVSGWQVYDNKGRTVEAYEPFFSTGFGYQPRLDEPLGRKSTMFYDPRGELIRTVNPDGSEQRVVHGVPADLTAPDRFTPTPWEAYSYDANDLAPLSRGSDAAPLTARAPATHHFTPSSIVVDALGRTVLAVARTRESTDTPGAAPPDIQELRTASTYDVRGNLLTVSDALGRVAFRYEYDLSDRAWRIESLDGGVRRMVLNAVDADLERRDSKGALILQSYDVLQRPTRVWAQDETNGRATLRQRLEYGDAGTPEQPSADREVMRQRNLLGQLARHHDEAGVSAVAQADFKGNVLEKSRRVVADAPILAVFERRAAADWRVTPFQMDWTVPADGTLAGREAELLEPSAYRTTTTYDALGRVTRMQYPDDVEGQRQELRAEYGRGGQLTQLSLGDSVQVERVAYDARGRRTLVAYGNGVLTRYAYDAETSRLARYRSERYSRAGETGYRLAGDVLQDVGCEYDLAGNIVALHDRASGSGVRNNPEAAATTDAVLARLLSAGDALTRRFEYDPNYRLLSASGRECDRIAERAPWDDRPRCSDPTKARAYTERYTYDAAGNMLRLEHRDATAGYTRTFTVGPDTDHLRRVQIGDLSLDYVFDANGNLRSETTTRHFEWDHVDQLKAFRIQAGTAEPSVHAHYIYGASGERVKKLVRKQGGEVEVTHYVDGTFEHHRWRGAGGNGENSELHVANGETRIAMRRIGPAQPGNRGPAVQFTLADHLGSSNVVTDGTGALVDREEYTPFGESSFGSFGRKRYRFTGCERDEESGLSYHANRYYAPGLTRWASCDPLGMDGGLNPYVYAANSPIGLVDTSGTQPAAWQQDADGNYIVPGETISIRSSAPAIDELEIQKRAGNSDYQSRSSVERELRYQLKTNTSDTSWMKPPPEPDWQAAGFPELAEEARAEAEAKWDAYVTKEYQKRRDAKVVELAKQQRRISAANTAGNIIGGVTIAGTLVVGAAATGVGTGVAALKARGTVFLGQQLVNSGATALTGSVLYGMATPPGSPDLPGPGDDGGRVVRGLLSRLTNAIATRSRGQREVIANPTFEQVKAMRPWFTSFQRWGGMIWGNGATGARDLIDQRTTEQLRRIPNLTIEAAMTLRNWLFTFGSGKGGQAPQHRIDLLNHIINRLQGR